MRILVKGGDASMAVREGAETRIPSNVGGSGSGDRTSRGGSSAEHNSDLKSCLTTFEGVVDPQAPPPPLNPLAAYLDGASPKEILPRSETGNMSLPTSWFHRKILEFFGATESDIDALAEPSKTLHPKDVQAMSQRSFRSAVRTVMFYTSRDHWLRNKLAELEASGKVMYEEEEEAEILELLSKLNITRSVANKNLERLAQYFECSVQQIDVGQHPFLRSPHYLLTLFEKMIKRGRETACELPCEVYECHAVFHGDEPIEWMDHLENHLGGIFPSELQCCMFFNIYYKEFRENSHSDRVTPFCHQGLIAIIYYSKRTIQEIITLA